MTCACAISTSIFPQGFPFWSAVAKLSMRQTQHAQVRGKNTYAIWIEVFDLHIPQLGYVILQRFSLLAFFYFFFPCLFS